MITDGRTTNVAIAKGLRILKVHKDKVNIKVLENEDKRSFFSILAPRVVKVEMSLKEDAKIPKRENIVKKEIVLSEEEQEKARVNVENFMKDFLKNLPENTNYEIIKTKSGLNVNINNVNLGYLIGYRGETLYALQNILTSIAGKGIENKVRVILDIEGYKAKREKTLEELAEKVARTVIRTRKSVTLEPMQAYERKIIHSKLQENTKVQTESIGEEPHRRVVVSYKR